MVGSFWPRCFLRTVRGCDCFHFPATGAQFCRLPDRLAWFPLDRLEAFGGGDDVKKDPPPPIRILRSRRHDFEETFTTVLSPEWGMASNSFVLRPWFMWFGQRRLAPDFFFTLGQGGTERVPGADSGPPHKQHGSAWSDPASARHLGVHRFIPPTKQGL